jgi:hypothetical protein
MVSAGPMIETANLLEYEKAVADGLASLAKDKIISRIWKKDWTVWRKEPKETRRIKVTPNLIQENSRLLPGIKLGVTLIHLNSTLMSEDV